MVGTVWELAKECTTPPSLEVVQPLLASFVVLRCSLQLRPVNHSPPHSTCREQSPRRFRCDVELKLAALDLMLSWDVKTSHDKVHLARVVGKTVPRSGRCLLIAAFQVTRVKSSQ